MDDIKKNLSDAVSDPSDTKKTAEETLPENKKGDASPSPPDDALERFLSREPEKAEKPKSGKSRRGVIALIAAIAAVAVLAVVLVLVRSQPLPSEEIALPAEVSLSVNENGEHEAAVPVDENGEIRQNGSGSLLTYVPSDIAQIDVLNDSGSFSVTSETPSGGSTVYTLVGFEDFPQQSGAADEIATDAAALNFTKIISPDGELSDFGLDEPTAVVKVHFHDGTAATVRVGDNAAGEAGTYIAFGSSSAVYLVDPTSVDSFLYRVTQFISREITASAEDTDSALQTLTISGTHYPEPITLEANTDEAIDAAYLVTAPRRMFANATESYDIAGNIRGLYAEEVVCVNPTADQLRTLGLSEPYAAVTAVYPDTTVTLHASAPADNGLVNLYYPDKNTVYSIQLAAVCWAKTSLDLLMPETPLNAKLPYVSRVDFKAGSTDFSVEVTTTTETVTGDDGTEQEVTDTTAIYNGETLSTQDFSIFFQNLNAIRNQGAADGTGDEVMRFTFTYTTGRAPDTMAVSASGTAKYALTLNGEQVGSVSKSYIDKLIEGAQSLIAGDPVPSL